MAAIDLERGLEHSGRGWGQERPELMDNFDSEMQEWEDQLQDIQRKIEELYNEVQARRGANDITTDSPKNGGGLDCEVGQNGNLFAADHHNTTHQPLQNYGNGFNYSPSGYSHQNGYGYCHNNGVHEIGDILQDYLGQGKQISRKNNGARHVRFSDTIKVSSDIPPYQDGTKRSGSERIGQEQFHGSFVENENKKNRVSHLKTAPCRESSINKENNACGKPPLKQRESPAVQSRPSVPSESPAQDRKVFGPGGLGDRSPSVLRKFGAMLHENEGKLLTESGVVTPQAPASEPKCSTPSCQRKALVGRVPGRVPTNKCQADSDVATAESVASQDRGLATDIGRQNQKDQRGGISGSKGAQPSPQPSQRRVQVPGSPKPRPRANNGADRDGARRTAPHHGQPKVDYTVLNGSPGAVRHQRGGVVRDEGLIELFDMLDIQHEYSNTRTGPTAYRPDTELDNSELFNTNPNKSFSRPARPANQRPPSRWASRTPPARITAPSGLMYRPPSPMTRTPSPALKHRNLISYSLQTETVIM